jgi:peptidoglycan/xylan/chitin deacetylase (PgdA/CDA1 family)
VSVALAPELALVLGFHGVVERIEQPSIQVNQLELAEFERIVDRVRAEYDVVALDDVAEALAGGGKLPQDAVALTFDDAYRSVLEVVDPVLQRHGLPYAVFVPSALVDSGARMPTYTMRVALAMTDRPSVQLPGRRRPYKLGTRKERTVAAGAAAEALRSLPQPDVADALVSLRALLSEEQWRELDARFASEQLLGWDELGALAARGVTIGSHTCDHVVLHGRQSRGEIRVQVTASKSAIEERLQMACRHFCYPHGTPADISRAAVLAVEEAGYSTAFMNVGGPVRDGMLAELLPRMPVTASDPGQALSARRHVSEGKWYLRIRAELAPGD